LNTDRHRAADAKRDRLPVSRGQESWTPKFFTLIGEGYGLGKLRADAVAGLAVAIVALPLAIAWERFPTRAHHSHRGRPRHIAARRLARSDRRADGSFRRGGVQRDRRCAHVTDVVSAANDLWGILGGIASSVD
jgi:hypothetical protein